MPSVTRLSASVACVLGAALSLSAGCGWDEPDAYRETRGRYTVVHLHGTPYEMGRQHARLLREELKAGVEETEKNILLKAMFVLARSFKLDELARKQSYPEVVEECQGMVDEAGSDGWTLEMCLVLNFGDAVAEFVQNGMPKSQDLSPGCAQLVAAGPAARDGKLYHARILDWSKIDYIIQYPVIFARRPDGGIPHLVIGFPGNLSPYQGINAYGLTVASNEVHPRDSTVNDLTGESHVQLVGRLLSRARSLDEARALIAKVNHMTLETLVLADGQAQTAAAFEMSPGMTVARELDDGVLMATNHFVAAKTSGLDRDPPPEGTRERYQRLQELALRTGKETRFGTLDPTSLVSMMRDRRDVVTGLESPASTFDDSKSLATNGALYMLVFEPAARRFWLAAGALPVPAQSFTGFSVDELLGRLDAAPGPAAIP